MLAEAGVAMAEKLPAAAILGWSVDDDHYESHRAAEQLAFLLEAELLGNSDYRWVDRGDIEAIRRELSLAPSSGISDAATWLRIGRWVKADILVAGDVQRTRGVWKLTGQIIDVERADVLSSWEMEVQGKTEEPLDIAGMDQTAWLASARESLARARKVYVKSRQQVAVAALHFENTTDVGRRLDHLEVFIEKAMAQKFSQDQDVRLLRFPGARQAASEHELVLSGLIDGQNARRNLADVYMWGNFREVDWEGVPFRQVQIEFTLNLWTGRGRPIKKKFRGQAGDLPALVDHVVDAALSWSRTQKPGRSSTYSSRMARDISQTLSKRAARLQEINRGNEWDVTNAFRHRWKRTVKLLEIAYFFDATNADLHRELIAERYREDLSYLNRVLYREPWRQAARDAEIQHHIDRFGFDVSWPKYFRRPTGGLIADNRLPDGTQMNEVAMRSLRGPLRRGAGLRETPDKVRQQERQDYKLIATRRAQDALDAVPNAKTLIAVLSLEIKSAPNAKVQLIERIWPKFDRRVSSHEQQWLGRLMRKVYDEVGRGEQAEDLIAQLKIVDPPQRKRPDRDPMPPDTGPYSDNMDFLPRLTQLAAPSDGWPPLLDIEVRDIKLPRFEFYEFPQIWRHGDSLWVNLLIHTHRGNIRELNTWRYTPADGKWHGTEGWVRTNRRITKALPAPAFDPDAVWLATEGHSVGRLNALTGESRVWGPVRGLTSTRFRDAVATKDRLVFSGGEHGEPGQLNMFLPETTDWIAVSIPFDDYGGTIIHDLAATDGSALLTATNWGSSPILMRYDFASGQWTSRRSQWLDHVRRAPDTQELRPQPRTDRLNPEVLHRDPDGQTIWIGSQFGLTRYLPAKDNLSTWFARPPVHPDDPPVQGQSPVRLFGAITAIETLPDGRHLVVATESRQSRRGLGGVTIGTYLFVFDKVAERWVGYLPLSLSGYTKVSQLLAYESELWISTARGDAKLMFIDSNQILRAIKH